MIVYPEINPNVFTIGQFSIKWYGVCYLIAFLLSYWQIMINRPKNFTKEQIENLFFYLAIGVIWGGRIGYILFYYHQEIISNPLSLLQFWLPGRSFHGGLLGVLVAVMYYSKKYNQSFFSVTDLIAPVAPIGIMLGRIGNFINGELWGRVTDVPWGMVFRHVDELPRHPSQLYELILEGLLLFVILRLCKYNKSAIFLIFYAVFRIVIENYREPDFDQGFIIAHFTMGQILSIPMLIIGLILYFKKCFKKLCGNT
jgi:phosphatidylglycerol---prolipoprotein diacylglyceryl transferase